VSRTGFLHQSRRYRQYIRPDYAPVASTAPDKTCRPGGHVVRGLLTQLCLILFCLIVPTISGFEVSAQAAFNFSNLNQSQNKVDPFESIDVEQCPVNEESQADAYKNVHVSCLFKKTNSIGSDASTNGSSSSNSIAGKLTEKLLTSPELIVRIWQVKTVMDLLSRGLSILDPPKV
jgi:hypothetical protein